MQIEMRKVRKNPMMCIQSGGVNIICISVHYV